MPRAPSDVPSRSLRSRSDIHDAETAALLEVVLGGIVGETGLVRRLSARSGRRFGLQLVRATVRSLEERGLIEVVGHEWAMLLRLRLVRATAAGRSALAGIADEIHAALLHRPRLPADRHVDPATPPDTPNRNGDCSSTLPSPADSPTSARTPHSPRPFPIVVDHSVRLDRSSTRPTTPSPTPSTATAMTPRRRTDHT